MEKLIELLNEYEKTTFEEDTNWVYEGEEWKYYEPNNRIIKGNWENEEVLTQYELCSKQFGFIKRLVDNDKIGFKKFDGDNYNYLENPIGSNNYDECDYLELIQWLAISDTPIEDLIYYLK